jgi:hypothetical protein
MNIFLSKPHACDTVIHPDGSFPMPTTSSSSSRIYTAFIEHSRANLYMGWHYHPVSNGHLLHLLIEHPNRNRHIRLEMVLRRPFRFKAGNMKHLTVLLRLMLRDEAVKMKMARHAKITPKKLDRLWQEGTASFIFVMLCLLSK